MLSVVTARRLASADSPVLSDADLVSAAREQQRWAEQALFQRHVKMALGLAHRLMPGSPDVDDVVQDAFVSALGHLSELKEPARFASWLRSIVIRGVSHRLRRHRLLVRLGLARSRPYELESLVAPSAPLEVQSEVQRVYAWLHTLPTEERVALVLRRVEELEIEEIADEMKLSPMTVKRRLKAAEGRLQRARSRAFRR